MDWREESQIGDRVIAYSTRIGGLAEH